MGSVGANASNSYVSVKVTVVLAILGDEAEAYPVRLGKEFG